MPTTRPRYQVTETPAVARALDLAARQWPHDTRSQLLARVLGVGSETLERQEQARLAEHARAVRSTSGKYTGAFSADHLTGLREDWPA